MSAGAVLLHLELSQVLGEPHMLKNSSAPGSQSTGCGEREDQKGGESEQSYVACVWGARQPHFVPGRIDKSSESDTKHCPPRILYTCSLAAVPVTTVYVTA